MTKASIATLALCLACSSAGTDIEDTDGGAVEDASAVDQWVTPDASPGSRTSLPIPASSIVAVQSAGGIDIDSALLGDSTLVFEHYADENLSSGTLMSVVVEANGFSAPKPMLLGSANLYGGPSAVGAHLYYVEAAWLTSAGKLFRRTSAAPETVQMPEPFALISCPQVRELNDGTFVVAYRDMQSVVKLAFSADGLAFGSPVELGPPGAMAKVAQMADDTLIFSYQKEVAPMLSYYRLSGHQKQWTEPALVTESSPNVHDTNPYRRADGRIDLYYIYPIDPIGFSLWRRCVKPDGSLGPEEQVVETTWGNLAKPHAHRLPSGATLLTFVDQNQGHRLSATTIVGDASCP